MRRFIFLTLSCMLICGLFRLIHAASNPPTFRSTTRLLIKQQINADSDAQQHVSFDILQSILYSDEVIDSAFNQPQMQPFRDRFSDDSSIFAGQANDAFTIEREVVSPGEGDIVALLHFESDDGKLAKAGVQSFAAAFQDWSNSQQNESRGELIRLISAAIEEIHPRLIEQERRHADFRRDAPLAWNVDGEAINPHRERQLFLTQWRSELYEELRSSQILLKQIERLTERAKSPETALAVISQLLDIPVQSFVTPPSNEPSIGKEWAEAIAERNRLAKELGEEDSSVTELDLRIDLFESELRKIAMNQIDQAFSNARGPVAEAVALSSAEQASAAVAAITYAKRAEVTLLTTQIENVDQQIASEKKLATKLAKYEQENNAFLRTIQRDRELLNQLQEQMSRVRLQTEGDRMTIVELTSPTDAYPIGLRAAPAAGIGALMGLGIGVLLTLLLGLVRPAKRAAA